jgi:hypothetical protein
MPFCRRTTCDSLRCPLVPGQAGTCSRYKQADPPPAWKRRQRQQTAVESTARPGRRPVPSKASLPGDTLPDRRGGFFCRRAAPEPDTQPRQAVIGLTRGVARSWRGLPTSDCPHEDVGGGAPPQGTSRGLMLGSRPHERNPPGRGRGGFESVKRQPFVPSRPLTARCGGGTEALSRAAAPRRSESRPRLPRR